MLNIFEQPWTLLTIAVFVLLVVLTVRQMFPEKTRPWHLLLPVALALAAFGLDYFIKTDLEKINTLIETSLKAVENQNLDAIEAIISPNYDDSYHNSKRALMAHCRSLLTKLPIKKNIKMNQRIEVSAPAATTQLKVLTRFDQQHTDFIELAGQSFLTTETMLYLVKGRDKNWLINRVEVLKINEHPIKWRQIGR